MSCTKSTTYTDADVQALVDAATEAVPRISASNQLARGKLLAALDPFQPEPDAELVQTVKGICHGANYAGDERWNHIIQVVREHDGRTK